MKVLLVGTSTNHEDVNQGNLGGFNHAYGLAFEELGWEVDSFHHRDFYERTRGKSYDLFLMRDTSVNPSYVAEVAQRCNKFAIFTHAEFIQARTMDVRFFASMKGLGCMPAQVFLDQPLGGERYKELEIEVPTTFLGWGANPACKRLPWEEKDIDVVWLGHSYEPRQTIVESLIYPLLKTDRVVHIYGRGQKFGPLSMPQMFDVLARSKVLVRISHPAHWEGGYSGRTVFDALASGCYVVHDKYPTCKRMFPTGVSFVPYEKISEEVIRAISLPSAALKEQVNRGYEWVRENGMVTHIAQKMLEILEMEDGK